MVTPASPTAIPHLLEKHPYLAQNSPAKATQLHPQWIVIDFGSPQPVDALRIRLAKSLRHKISACS